MGSVVRCGCSWSCSGRLGEGVCCVRCVSLTSRWCVWHPSTISCSWITRPSAPGLSGCRALSNSSLQSFFKWSYWLYSQYRVSVSIRPCTLQSLTTHVTSYENGRVSNDICHRNSHETPPVITWVIAVCNVQWMQNQNVSRSFKQQIYLDSNRLQSHCYWGGCGLWVPM